MTHLRPALILLAVLTVVTGVIYPVIVQVVFPYQANGSLIVKDGKVVGSALIGQPFDDPKYFWGRPSATSPFPYNAAASSGSNLGPTNPALRGVAKARKKEPAAVEALVARHTEGRTFNVLGELRVNVLALNLALDAK